MINAIIVDDEETSRMTLSKLVEMHCPGVMITALCDSVPGAKKAIEKLKPDLVFLDVEMPFQNGFTLLEEIKSPCFRVVFTTAYNHYAIKAIKYSALDYLLKPIDTDELVSAIDKIKQQKQSNALPIRDFEILLSNLQAKGMDVKIAVPAFDGLQMINTKDIIKCTAHESYTGILLESRTELVVSKILKECEELLSGLNFFRVHNSCLINLSHVVKYIKGDGGYVIMSNGDSVEVSRRKKNELLNKLARVQV
jgi:two-component system, LytTR family, response regulator